MRRLLAGALAPLTQFVRPSGAYRLLSDPGAAPAAIISSCLLTVLVFTAPLLLLDLDSASGELGESIREQAVMNGMSPADADSAAVSGVESARGQVLALPGAMMLERGVMVLLAAASAFAVYRAAGFRDGFAVHLRTAVLSQAGFALVWGGMLALESSMPSSAFFSRPELLLGDPGSEPGRMFVFSWLFLSGCNPAALVSVILWGLGIAASTDRKAGNGLSTAFGIYLVSLFLFAMPVFLGS